MHEIIVTITTKISSDKGMYVKSKSTYKQTIKVFREERVVFLYIIYNLEKAHKSVSRLYADDEHGNGTFTTERSMLRGARPSQNTQEYSTQA